MAKSFINVGWCIDHPDAKFVFIKPKSVFQKRTKALSSSAVQACPAVNEFERNVFIIECPFNIRLRCIKNKDNYELYTIEDGTRIDEDLLISFIYMMPPNQWRDKNKPTLQMKIPYFFITDEPCMLTQTPPYMSDNFLKWPGSLISGRFPTHIWPRTLNFAFEWLDLDNDLILKRGDDLFYVQFEFETLTQNVRLQEAELTEELIEYRRGIIKTPKFMSNTFSLFETAKERRPKKLFTPKKGNT